MGNTASKKTAEAPSGHIQQQPKLLGSRHDSLVRAPLQDINQVYLDNSLSRINRASGETQVYEKESWP